MFLFLDFLSTKMSKYLKQFSATFLSDSNVIRTHNRLVRLNHLVCLAKWLSVRLRTKWLWVHVAVT